MPTPEHATVLLVFVPLLAACAAVLLPARWRAAPVLVALLSLPLLLLPVSAQVHRHGLVELAMAGHAPPLGIRLRVDALSLLMLWLVALAGGAAGLHALALFRPASSPPAPADRGGASPGGHRAAPRTGEEAPSPAWPIWPLWLLMTAGLNALFVSADLFNVYVAIELTTLAAIALVVAPAHATRPAQGARRGVQAQAQGPRGEALRAAMRYLLLAMLGSLALLLGVALLYGAHGTLDLYDAAARLAGADTATLTALALMSAGLLLKGAIFPLHVWLPGAHAQAPGPVSAVLSALVVKTGVYLLYRLWFWSAAGLDRDAAAWLLGALGAGAVLYGSAAALVQDQLKRVVAYSTVAQLGYLLLVFPLLGHASAWSAAGVQLVSHGLAKAGMFLAAANIVHALGSGRLDGLAGADRVLPASVFAFGLAGVSLMGLPPSGGFLAKWLLLEAAWARGAWGWIAVVLAGSLLAAGYVFRVLAAVFREPAEPATTGSARDARDARYAPQAVPQAMTAAALLLALAAIALGLAAAPLVELLGRSAPPGFAR